MFRLYFLTFFCLVAIAQEAHTQVENVIVPNSFNTSTQLNYQGQFLKMSSGNDTEIRGNRFWDTRWRLAAVRLKTGWVKVRQLKLDLYSDQVILKDLKG